MRTTRIPTDHEIASALAYLESQYTSNTYDGEQIAEALAFARQIDFASYTRLDRCHANDLLNSACLMRISFKVDQWTALTARADYLRRTEGNWSDPTGQHGTAPRYEVRS